MNRTALIKPIFRGLVFTGLAFAGAAWSSTARAQSKPASASAVVMAADKGKFRILLAGQSIGTEDFEISSSEGKWIVRGSTEAHTPGGDDMKTTGELHLAADGTAIHYAWSTDSPKKASGSVDFDGGTAKTLTDFGSGHPYHQDFKFVTPNVVVLDNNLYEQYAVLARIYDWSAGGEQSFPVLIPQDITPGSIKVSAAGASGGLSELIVKSADLEIHLFCDAGHKLMRIEVPASQVVVERQ
ncbi:MAG: hypothetical protein WBF06_14420 [Candidatus Acidiferrales bacterium]